MTITVRVGDHTAAGFRDIDGRIRSLDGRFATAAGSMQRSSSKASGALLDMKASLLSLAPAAVPVAASLAPIVVQAGAAGLALGAFGAAVAGQVGHLSDASKAQSKYSDSVAQYGRGSKQASEAARGVQTTMASMPQATARAAVALSTLKDGVHSFSDSTAKFTMVPVEKSFAVLGQIIPKLTPMAKGASTQLDRLVTVAGGAVNTAGFDSLSKKVSDFANSSLKKAVDGAIHFGRVMSEGNAHGPMTEFMDYARQQGPAVKELFSNVASAAGNIAQGAAQAGPGLLTVVNALAKLASAVPPELVGTLMQTYAAFKLIKLGGAGIATVAGGVTRLTGSLTTLRAASVAAGGGIAGLRAAFMTLGTATKATVVVAGIAAAVAVIGKLNSMGKDAPPNVDRLTTALGRLGSTGKVTGEAASKFGSHFETLKSQMDKVLNPSVAESVNNWGHSISGGLLKGGDASEELTGSFKAIDESLAGMVKGGNAKLAAAALKNMLATMSPEQVKKLMASIGDYKGALADQALEQKLAAQSMGEFGAAAQATQAQLDAQKQSADGLRASIFALNDVNRSAYDSQISFEASLDNLSEAFKKNGATLNISSDAGRLNGQAMSAAAKSNDEMIASGVAANETLASMTKKSGVLRSEMTRLATEAFDGNRKKATEYVNTLLGVPSDIKTLVKLERENAISGLHDVEAAIKATPGAKQIKVDALNGAAIKALGAVGLKTKQLPDGKTAVYTSNGQALGGIAAVARALNALNGKKATTYTFHEIHTNYSTSRSVSGGKSVHDMVGATGGLYTGKGGGFRYADGGPVRGPGTGTSDDVPAPWLSNGEFVIKAAAVQKYGEKFLHRVNDGQFEGPKFAKGGKVTQAEKDARSSLRGQFGISAFGRAAGYQRTPFEHNLGAPADLPSLVTSLNTARGEIKAGTRGGTESRLLRQLDSVGKSLIKYDKQLNAVNKSLETAKSKLSDLKNSAAQLSDSVKSNILSSSNITKGASGGGPVTVASIMGASVEGRDKAQAFANALKGLKSKGLDKGLLQDIASAGVEGGGLETAGALMGASASEISSLNTLRSQTVTYAKQAGGTTADAVYGAAIKAQTATVAKLQKSQDKLEKTMAHLAKVMEKSISRAIGKKAAGGIVGAAASGGLRGGLTWVGEHEPELLDLPVGSRVWSGPDSRRKAAAPWDSMLNVPRRGTYGAGQQQPVKIEVEVVVRGGGNHEYEEFLLRNIRKSVKARGGNAQVVLGSGRP
ncbi:phage tail protein [Streptomyces sp. NPDC006333]|uniref:phage tail protein n=1 Tax=Streptomyces sp. NPDC006333 TaxID=3156753 RepID=UPI00339E427A